MSTLYQQIISSDNLFLAWREFVKGKRNRKDVEHFFLHLSHEIHTLHKDLKNKTYIHSSYQSFNISDPKSRNIHKAVVRDRLLHRAIYRVLYPHFDKRFIDDSYSCRDGKGTHKAMETFRRFYWKESKNNTRTVWVLKCDIRKFFANIDHEILLNVLKKRGIQGDTLWLLNQVIQSFDSGIDGKGLPLGNLTSQLLVNMYMNEFDEYMKHILKMKYYIRYADDFIVLSCDREYLNRLLHEVSSFLAEKLKLELHPDKVFIKTMASGVDFLGWVHFPDHRVLRTTTKRRMMKRIEETGRKPETLESYLGMLQHGNSYKLQSRL